MVDLVHPSKPIPDAAAERKLVPMGTGLLDYFPDALASVAHLSYIGNQQHNPGQPLHWARGKSTDHADCIIRHFLGRGTIDTDGVRHSVKLLWRAAALLQEELEAVHDLPQPRGCTVPARTILEAVGAKEKAATCRATAVALTKNDRQLWSCTKCAVSWDDGTIRPCQKEAITL